jgi:hypothetical protein
MKRLFQSLLLVAALLLGAERHALALGVTGGDVPLPAKTVNGKLQLSWNGTYAELLAADALAMCWSTQLEGPDDGTSTDADAFIRNLAAKMAASTCKTSCSDGAVVEPGRILYCAWLDGRKDANCNIDAASGNPKSLDISKLRSPDETAAYKFPQASTGPSPLGISGTSANDVRWSAQHELAYAELNLCIAQQLRQKLDTVQVAFASGDDLLSIQERVRERALSATYEYSVISKVLATTLPAPTVINNDEYYLAPFAIWGRGTFTSPESWMRIGDDFAAAIGLLTEATEAAIELDVRQPSAQGSFGEVDYPNASSTGTEGSPDVHPGVKGPRVDIVDQILYDWQYWMTAPRRAVLTDMSAPEVGVLLGLARRANALQFAVSGSRFDRGASAANLFNSVENMLRTDDCMARNIHCPGDGPPTTPKDYVLWQRYGIEQSHAQTIVDAFATALFGFPMESYRDSPTWYFDRPVFSKDFFGPFGPAEQLAFHLLGNNAFDGTIATSEGVVNIDPDFRVLPLRAHDIQSMRGATFLPVRDVDPRGDAVWQIKHFRGEISEGPTYHRNLGSNTVLALAREALLQLGALPSTSRPRNIYDRAAPAVDLIETMIGSRQVLVRQKLASMANSAACTGCVTLHPSYQTISGTNYYTLNVDMITKSDDPLHYVSVGPGIPHAATLVLDRLNTQSIWDTNGDSIDDNAFYMPLTEIALQNGYRLRSVSGLWSASEAEGTTVLLAAEPDNLPIFEHVFTGQIGLEDGPAVDTGVNGTCVTYGGQFAHLVENTWKFDRSNWSKPAYDAFGLPHDWAPAADASLQGDQGVSVEQHFLSRAATAATEATTALQQAFDTLQQESQDDVTLASSDAKAQELTKLGLKALCGAKPDCRPSYTRLKPTVPGCLTTNSTCPAFQSKLGDIVASPPNGAGGTGVSLATDVYDALQAGTASPEFSLYDGGRIQGLLLSQWNAWQGLVHALESAMGSAGAAMEQVLVAGTEVHDAHVELDSVRADVIAAYEALGSQVIGLTAQKVIYEANRVLYDEQLGAAQHEADVECGDDAFELAFRAGWTWSGDDINFFRYNGDIAGGQEDSKSWSYAAWAAQKAQCQKANDALALATATLNPQRDAMQGMADALQTQIDLFDLQFDALPKHIAAAQARYEVAIARESAARLGSYSQQASAAQAVQAAYGQLLSTVVAIKAAFGEADVATSRVALDQQLQDYDIRSRFGLRKRFHSFDLWRARALSENARRLALAARRAIESRYVVDLSKLSAPEPFVDAPALWADDIYGSDLKPPVALGLTKSPTTASGIYTNKLQDYVNNLKLFLDGYTVERPSAAVLSDAEVVQLPGPAHRVVGTSYDADFSYIDPDSMGWTFYCAANDTWIAYPNVGAFSTDNPSSPLATACGFDPAHPEQPGKPPTLARLGFSLDPWGRLKGTTTDPPFNERYNVRTGNLALNLVGSGIRDCEKAVDKPTCYAEPFIRFDLQHVGPVWVTDYAQKWRGMNIPVAVIEGGKALATEEWLDPVSNGFNRTDVSNVMRMELHGRPVGGFYEITLALNPDVRVERIERIQLLVQTEYWVRQRQ